LIKPYAKFPLPLKNVEISRQIEADRSLLVFPFSNKKSRRRRSVYGAIRENVNFLRVQLQRRKEVAESYNSWMELISECIFGQFWRIWTHE